MLGLSCTPEPGSGVPVIWAVLARVLAGGRLAGTVALVLGPGTDLDADAGAALRIVADQLATAGVRLRLATSCTRVRQQLADAGLARRLGESAIHPSLRSAVLAVYAGQPGPGLVTPEVRAAMLKPAEPVGPAVLPTLTPVPARQATAGAAPAGGFTR